MGDILSANNDNALETLKEFASRQEIAEVLFQDERIRKGKLYLDGTNVFLELPMIVGGSENVAFFGEERTILFFETIEILRDEARQEIEASFKKNQEMFEILSQEDF